MKPEKFLKDIKEYIDEHEIDIESVTSDNISFENYEQLLWGNDTFAFRFGATRGCFIPEEYSPSFVFKFDFAELWEEYCENEMRIYKEARAQGLGNCFTKIYKFDKIYNTWLYKCEYVDKLEENSPFKPLSEEELNKILTIESSHQGGRRPPSSWASRFIEYHGADTYDKFLSFINEYGVNDLHTSNIGYIKGRPVVLDYAGFFEPSGSYCN